MFEYSDYMVYLIYLHDIHKDMLYLGRGDGGGVVLSVIGGMGVVLGVGG